MGVMDVGTRLKQLREAARLEIQEVADKVGKSYQYISQLEKGANKPPTWSLLRDLATIYGSSVDEILDVPGSNKVEYPPVNKTVLNSVANMTEYQLEALVQISKILQTLENQARGNFMKEILGIVMDPIEMRFGKNSSDDLYRALDLFRGTSDESALAAWFSRYFGSDDSSDGNE
jgi:transcriptional regulator with XRE-family HTH domain